MKKAIITMAALLSCTFLPACGDRPEPEGPWIGMLPVRKIDPASVSGRECNTETLAESGVTAANCFVYEIG